MIAVGFFLCYNSNRLALEPPGDAAVRVTEPFGTRFNRLVLFYAVNLAGTPATFAVLEILVVLKILVV